MYDLCVKLSTHFTCGVANLKNNIHVNTPQFHNLKIDALSSQVTVIKFVY